MLTETTPELLESRLCQKYRELPRGDHHFERVRDTAGIFFKTGMFFTLVVFFSTPISPIEATFRSHGLTHAPVQSSQQNRPAMCRRCYLLPLVTPRPRLASRCSRIVSFSVRILVALRGLFGGGDFQAPFFCCWGGRGRCASMP